MSQGDGFDSHILQLDELKIIGLAVEASHRRAFLIQQPESAVDRRRIDPETN